MKATHIKKKGYPFICDEKGSMIVEYAVFLPIFIIAVLTLAFILRFFYIQESVHQIICDEVRTYMVESVTLPYGIGEVLFKKRVDDRIREIKNGEGNKIKYFVSEGLLPKDEILDMNVSLKANITLPIQIKDYYDLECPIKVRKWLGKKVESNSMPFSQMEREERSELVYVFPRAGERSHKEDCNYITNQPRERILSKAIRDRYRPCKLCDPINLANGMAVYCFRSDRSVYHSGKCALVDKYVISLTKDEAKDKGYEECKKCMGKE